jgi:hypothetical protein
MSSTLGTCNSRVGTAAREHALGHPDADVFRRLEQRLRETGSVTGRPRTARTPANEDCITAVVEQDNDMARQLGLTQRRVLVILHDDQLHLFPDNRPLRMQFCE